MQDNLPISELKNDGASSARPANSAYGEYAASGIDGNEKHASMIRLLTELARGVDSLRKEGGLTIEEAFEGLTV